MGTDNFDILKPATSRMISNDAIETSVFITETMGEDSVSITLTMFAASELLIFQNRFEEAMSKLDSINFLLLIITLKMISGSRKQKYSGN